MTGLAPAEEPLLDLLEQGGHLAKPPPPSREGLTR